MRDTSVHMAGQFGPWGLTVRYLGRKCLLDTLVLVPKCQTLWTHLNNAKVSQCRTELSGPKCLLTMYCVVMM